MKLPDTIEEAIIAAGAYRVRAVNAEPVDALEQSEYEKWLDLGCHASMTYLEAHAPLRTNLNSVLPSTRTIISIAFNFYPEAFRSEDRAYVAMYAYGKDYHNVIRKRLRPVVKWLEDMGGKARICIDSAPVAERYYACRSGLGYRGLNGAIIIPQAGSCFILAEILTTLDLPLTPDEKLPDSCMQCGLCVKKCPGGALHGDGTLDARRCISYLSIEHKGEFSPSQHKIMAKGKTTAFGCDACLRVCPHNAHHPATNITEFTPLEHLHSLCEAELKGMTNQDFDTLYAGSPLRRAGRENLLRNLDASHKP